MSKTTPSEPRRSDALSFLARVSIAALMGICLWAPPAMAQLTPIGSSPDLGAAPVRGTDTAYDPVNKVYLVVGSTAGNVSTPLFGVFTNASGVDNTQGVPVTAPFQINIPGEAAQFPRVVYSPHVSNGAGGFLVTWHGGFPTSVRTRIVAFPTGVVSAQGQIPSVRATLQEAGASVAYGNQMFLVTWQDDAFTVRGARIGLDGQPIGTEFLISEPGGARDPSVAWNPDTNEFGVLYTGFGAGGATTTFARVDVTGTVLRRNTFNVTTLTFITDLAFNPGTGRFVGVWSQGNFVTHGAEIDANGDVVAAGLVSTTTGSTDGLGLSYSPVSGTFLVVGQGNSANILAAELNARGARTSADREVSFAGGPVGSFYPRATANTNAPDWNISFDHNHVEMRDQVVRTSSTGGGPAGSLGAVSPPPPSSGGGSTGGCTTPSPGIGWTCVNGGWVPPTSGGGSTGGGSTGGCTTPSPGAGFICVNGGWVPSTSGGGSTGGGTTGGCTTPSPGIGWTCVNGGWLPPTSGGGSTGGGTTGGCTTPSPGAGFICVNGGWVPGSTSSNTCTTPSPGIGWTCVNGGWLPPSTSSTGCSTPDPFVAIGGGVCINGGWVPKS